MIRFGFSLKRVLLMLVVLAIVVPTYAPLGAAELKGVKMADSIEVDGQKLVLNGLALRKKVIFKVYVAGLYLTQKEKNAGKILAADTARQAVMHFLRDVPKGKITDAWLEGLQENTPKASPELKKQFQTLCAAMEDMKEEQRLVFTYIPGKGTKIEVNGKNKGVLEGKAFSDALTACWIGPNPGPGESFKEDILGL